MPRSMLCRALSMVYGAASRTDRITCVSAVYVRLGRLAGVFVEGVEM